MANGDLIEARRYYRHVTLIDAKVAVDVGQWIDCAGYDQYSIHVSGITTATIKVNSSNKATQPDNTDHEIERSSVTADAEIISATLPKWIKARISAWTSGTVIVTIVLRRTGGLA